VDDHHRGNDKQENEIHPLRVEDARVGNEMHGVSDEEGERPAATDERAGEHAVAVEAFKIDAGAKDEEADEIAESDFRGIAERGKFIGKEERDADDEGDDAQFVEPVGAESFFELRTDFARGGGRGFWRRR